MRLKSFPEGLETLTNLKYLTISSCGDLASFPKGGFPDSNLSVILVDCIKLEALPSGLHLLSSLAIFDCVKISHLPTELEKLGISNLNQYKAVVECGLHNCNSLRSLRISSLPSEDSLSVTSMEMALPPNLNVLQIASLPLLKCLNFKDFESLSFLEQLSIWSCPELTSLPSILPSSLERLWISNCPKLTSLPSILPSSLMSLEIDGCPSLSKVCKRNIGKEWPKIADIPHVMIDYRSIYDPDE